MHLSLSRCRLDSSMVEQLTLNQLVRGSSPRPATSEILFDHRDTGWSLLGEHRPTPAPVAFGHVDGMASPAVAVVGPAGLDPVEGVERQALGAERADLGRRGRRLFAGAAAPAHPGREAGSAVWVQETARLQGRETRE